jgi:hypothetical protein
MIAPATPAMRLLSPLALTLTAAALISELEALRSTPRRGASIV